MEHLWTRLILMFVSVGVGATVAIWILNLEAEHQKTSSSSIGSELSHEQLINDEVPSLSKPNIITPVLNRVVRKADAQIQIPAEHLSSGDDVGADMLDQMLSVLRRRLLWSDNRNSLLDSEENPSVQENTPEDILKSGEPYPKFKVRHKERKFNHRGFHPEEDENDPNKKGDYELYVVLKEEQNRLKKKVPWLDNTVTGPRYQMADPLEFYDDGVVRLSTTPLTRETTFMEPYRGLLFITIPFLLLCLLVAWVNLHCKRRHQEAQIFDEEKKGGQINDDCDTWISPDLCLRSTPCHRSSSPILSLEVDQLISRSSSANDFPDKTASANQIKNKLTEYSKRLELASPSKLNNGQVLPPIFVPKLSMDSKILLKNSTPMSTDNNVTNMII